MKKKSLSITFVTSDIRGSSKNNIFKTWSWLFLSNTKCFANYLMVSTSLAFTFIYSEHAAQNVKNKTGNSRIEINTYCP